MHWFVLAFSVVLQDTALNIAKSKGPGIAISLAKTKASKYLENGDIAKDNVRNLLLDDLQRIQNSVDAIRNKELQAATFSLNTAYDFNINNNWQEAKKEFAKARERAEMAFGVVKDRDKVTAVQIGCLAAAYEFPHNPLSVRTICFSFLKRLYELPYIKKNYKGLYFDDDHHFQGLSVYAADRVSLIAIMTEVYYTNKTIWKYLNEFDILKTSNKPFPSLYVTTSKNVNISFDIEHQITNISLCNYLDQEFFLYVRSMCSLYLAIIIVYCSLKQKTKPTTCLILLISALIIILGLLFLMSFGVDRSSQIHRIYMSILQPLFLPLVVYVIVVWIIIPRLPKSLRPYEYPDKNPTIWTLVFWSVIHVVVLFLFIFIWAIVTNPIKIRNYCVCNTAEWEAYASTKSNYETEYEDLLAPLWKTEL